MTLGVLVGTLVGAPGNSISGNSCGCLTAYVSNRSGKCARTAHESDCSCSGGRSSHEGDRSSSGTVDKVLPWFVGTYYLVSLS